jgi:hypothetical protein
VCTLILNGLASPPRPWAPRPPDLTRLPVIDPDDAKTRCSFVMNCFPVDTHWMAPQNGEHTARRDWPPEIWNRDPGHNDVLLHPAVRAVMIYCEAKQR